MKTKKQVMAEFARLQRRYEGIRGFVTLKTYTAEEEGVWDVEITVSHFEGRDIDWSERVNWMHYTVHNERFEAENEAKVAEFVKRMEKRMNIINQ